MEVILNNTKKIPNNWKIYHADLVLTQVLAAIISGLISYFLRKSVNEYIIGILGALIGGIGFLLCILANSFEPRLFCIAVFMVAIASGIWWVMAALIVYDDAGPGPFCVLLSMVYLAAYWGMTTFGFIFESLTHNLDDPFIGIFVTFIVGSVAAIVACVVALSMDEK